MSVRSEGECGWRFGNNLIREVDSLLCSFRSNWESLLMYMLLQVSRYSKARNQRGIAAALL
jgi:hypothetical protein